MRNVWLICVSFPLSLAAQDTRMVHAQLERPDILIGEQVALRLHAPADGPAVRWPVLGDSITAAIEVVKDSGVDTVALDGMEAPAALVAARVLTLTSFDTGYWAIPPFRFQVGGVEQETEALLLHVKGVEVDSTGTPRPYRPMIEPPFSIVYWASEHWPWIAGISGIAVLAALLLFLLKRRKQPEAPVEVPEVPVHARYLAALEALEKERLWQQGEHKAYQSRLTDLLRAYIEERYHVPALERTTDELMHELRVSPLNTEQQALLGNMLRLADMVKFAKATPTALENEQMMTGAVRFVQDTALAEMTHAAR